MGYLYILLVITYPIAVFSVQKYQTRRNIWGSPLPNPIGFIVPAVLFTAFSGLRRSIGDTYFYIHAYNLKMDGEMTLDGPINIFRGNGLFEWLEWFLVKQGFEYQVFIFITAMGFVMPAIYILYRYSELYELSIYMFVMTGVYMLSMNGIRQYLAAGILMLFGTKYLFSMEKGAWWKFTLVCLACYTIHASALFMIPAFFVVRRKAFSLSSIAIIVVAVMVALMFNSFLGVFTDSLEGGSFDVYSRGWFTDGEESGSNPIRVLVMLVPVVLAYMARDRIEVGGPKVDILVNLGILNAAIYIVSLYNWIFARFAIYTSVYFIMLLCWSIKNVRIGQNINSRGLYLASMVLFLIYIQFIAYNMKEYRSDYINFLQ